MLSSYTNVDPTEWNPDRPKYMETEDHHEEYSNNEEQPDQKQQHLQNLGMQTDNQFALVEDLCDPERKDSSPNDVNVGVENNLVLSKYVQLTKPMAPNDIYLQPIFEKCIFLQDFPSVYFGSNEIKRPKDVTQFRLGTEIFLCNKHRPHLEGKIFIFYGIIWKRNDYRYCPVIMFDVVEKKMRAAPLLYVARQPLGRAYPETASDLEMGDSILGTWLADFKSQNISIIDLDTNPQAQRNLRSNNKPQTTSSEVLVSPITTPLAPRDSATPPHFQRLQEQMLKVGKAVSVLHKQEPVRACKGCEKLKSEVVRLKEEVKNLKKSIKDLEQTHIKDEEEKKSYKDQLFGIAQKMAEERVAIAQNSSTKKHKSQSKHKKKRYVYSGCSDSESSCSESSSSSSSLSTPNRKRKKKSSRKKKIESPSSGSESLSSDCSQSTPEKRRKKKSSKKKRKQKARK